jgi:hypothetical protein
MNFNTVAEKFVQDFDEKYKFIPENLEKRIISFIKSDVEKYIYEVNFKKVTKKRNEIPDNVWNFYVFPWFGLPSDLKCKILSYFDSNIFSNLSHNSIFGKIIEDKPFTVCGIPSDMFPNKFWKIMKHKILENKKLKKVIQLNAFEEKDELKTCAILLRGTYCKMHCNYCLKVTEDMNLKEINIDPAKKYIFLHKKWDPYSFENECDVLDVKTRKVINLEDHCGDLIYPRKYRNKFHDYFGKFMLKLHVFRYYTTSFYCP